MVHSLAVRSDISEERRKEYLNTLEHFSDKALLKEFLSYLDYTEESDSGRVFHPITIGCARCLMAPCLEMLLDEMRKRV
jgi:hypothetical protein